MAYGREEVAAAVTYKFQHSPPSLDSEIAFPGFLVRVLPSTDKWQWFIDKENTVMDLIRHLPYAQPEGG